MKKVVHFVVFLSIVLTFPLLFAQEQKTEPALAMAKLKVAPELVRLSFLVGEFTTDTKIHPNRWLRKGKPPKGV